MTTHSFMPYGHRFEQCPPVTLNYHVCFNKKLLVILLTYGLRILRMAMSLCTTMFWLQCVMINAHFYIYRPVYKKSNAATSISLTTISYR